MRRLVARMIAPIAACALAGCAVGPDYALPDEAMVRSETANGAFVESANSGLTPKPPPDDWWRLYRDPRLDRLIEQALAANTDLRVAEAILEKSAALLQQAEAARQPSVVVNFDTSYQQLSSEAYLQTQVVPGASLYDTGVSVAYDLDLFGRLRRTVEAVNADDEAVAAARDLVKVNVVADTTRSFLDLCDAGAELSVARENLEVQRASLAVTRRLVEAGKDNSLDETRSRGLTAQLEAALPTLEARRRNAVFRLATLTGRPPAEFDRGLSSCAASPRILAPLPVGDGAQLLKRRPDVRAAERRLAAATAEIGVATALLYPSVKLMASVGSTGMTSDFLTPPTNRYGVGPSISWQLNQNIARARIAAANAATKAALARFDGAVLQALRETESALNVYVHDLTKLQNLRTACLEADRALADARKLQTLGRIDALSVLDAERTRAAANLALAMQRSQISLDQVGVFLALGGGWRGKGEVAEF